MQLHVAAAGGPGFSATVMVSGNVYSHLKGGKLEIGRVGNPRLGKLYEDWSTTQYIGFKVKVSFPWSSSVLFKGCHL